MTRYNTRLLTPPKEEEEIHPYRRPWQSIVYTIGILAAISVGTFVLFNFLGIRIPDPFERYVTIGVVCLPLFAWLLFAWWPERQVPQPRVPLFSVMLVGLLTANALIIPFVDGFLDVASWLSLQPAIDRIIGYTITVGMVNAFVAYGILRFIVWQNFLRNRLDTIAYGEALAVGLTTVNNFVFISQGNPPLDIVAARVYSHYAIQIVSASIVAYGMSISRFAPGNLFTLPSAVLLAAISTGLAVPLRSGLINASFQIEGITAPRPIFGLGFTIAFSIAPLIVVSFFIANADRKDQEATRSEL